MSEHLRRGANREVGLGHRPELGQGDAALRGDDHGVVELKRDGASQPGDATVVSPTDRAHLNDDPLDELDALLVEQPDLAHALVLVDRDAVHRHEQVECRGGHCTILARRAQNASGWGSMPDDH